MVEKSQDKEMDKSVAVGNVENNSEKDVSYSEGKIWLLYATTTVFPYSDGKIWLLYTTTIFFHQSCEGKILLLYKKTTKKYIFVILSTDEKSITEK